MKADKVLEQVKNTLVNRGKERDVKEERSSAKAVQFYKMLKGSNIIDTEADGWLFLMALKMARYSTKPQKDSLVDLIGYTSLHAEAVWDSIAD